MKLIYSILFCIFLYAFPNIAQAAEKAPLYVHFIKTTKMTDAILIDLGTTEILIDGGYARSGVAKYMKDHVDGELEVVIATHPHADHIGGLIEILDQYTVREIWTNGEVRSLSTHVKSLAPHALTFYEKVHTNFIEKAKQEKAELHVALQGENIVAGELSFTILHPSKMYPQSVFTSIKKAYQAVNNNSIVLRLVYGEVSFLFTGDILEQSEQELLASGVNLQADILKVAHHGSTLASSLEFLKKVRPKIAVCMGSGEKPAQGQVKPHPITVKKLETLGATVYSTGRHGTIVISTDGKKYSVKQIAGIL